MAFYHKSYSKQIFFLKLKKKYFTIPNPKPQTAFLQTSGVCLANLTISPRHKFSSILRFFF